MPCFLIFPLLMTVISTTQILLVTDKTVCWNCSDPSGCQENVVGAKQAQLAVNWTVSRLVSRGRLDRENTGVTVVDTCTDEKTAMWELMRILARLELDKLVNQTNPPHLLLASGQLNSRLTGLVTSLQLPVSLVTPSLSIGLVRAASRLTRTLGWTQVAVLSDLETGNLLGQQLDLEDICLVERYDLPNSRSAKDQYTGLLSNLTQSGVNKVIVSGEGKDIARLVRNIFELNLSVSIIALPWDGQISQMPGSDLDLVTVFQIVPTYQEMPEFMEDQKTDVESPLSWQLSRAVFGLLVHQEVGVDDMTARSGLGMRRQSPRYRIDKLDIHSARWRSVGVHTEGEINWSNNTGRLTVSSLATCEWCQCVNRPPSQANWRTESWISGLASVSGLGCLCVIALYVFLATQCGQVLEGSQVTTVTLLTSTLLLYLCMLPYCLTPGDVVCGLRSLAPGIVYTLTMATILSRSLLLATSDNDGLPGHASGFLQFVLLVLFVCVQAGMVIERVVFAQISYMNRGKFGRLRCIDGGWPWLYRLIWPLVLLLLQLMLTPAIWRSRRNYKEGVLFCLVTVGIGVVTAVWITIYILCTETYGPDWEDISVCVGLVSTATIILLVVFIPKVYLMTVWGVSKEVTGGQMPGTTTSTLHTDTIDYVRAPDIYKLISPDNNMTENLVYTNHPGNRRGLLPNLVQTSQNQYSNPVLQLGVVGLNGITGPPNSSTFKLDQGTESEPNMSWEPFNSSLGKKETSHLKPTSTQL